MKLDAPRSMGRVRRRGRAAATVALALVAGCGGASDDARHAGAVASEVRVQISGETLATGGLAFPASGAGEPALADGWALSFDRVLVSVGNITLSEAPDLSPSDPSRTGAVVARADGPWIVDLHAGGPLAGKGGGGERATAVTTLGGSFEEDQRYAFGFETVPASDAATRLRLSADDPDVVEMVQRGWTVLYVGVAEHRGTDCATSEATYDWSKVPARVPFRLGFATPTAYVNCQNADNDPADPFEGEEHQRGLAFRVNAPAIAQLTLHLDHAFYSSVTHEPALRFDALAARRVGGDAATPVGLDDLAGIDPTALTDATGAALPWRSCGGALLPAGAQARYETGTVPVNPSATPDRALRDLRDFLAYTQSTQGHMNGGDGLCFARRRFPSPP